MENNSVPQFLEEMLQKEYGEELTLKIEEGYRASRRTTLRVNTLKSDDKNVTAFFEENGIEYIPAGLPSSYFILNKTAHDLYNTSVVEEGSVYLQSLSSMLPPLYLDPKEGEDILDMAAAPGGKTTLMAAMTKNKARITAVEVDKIRSERLRYNVLKQNATNVFVMNADAKKLDDFFSFDKILLDAPCSGSGTVDLNDKRPLKISKPLVLNSAKLQAELLKKALKILKPGCDMVYSTCSVLKEENEMVLKKVMPSYSCEIVPLDAKDLPVLPSLIQGVITVMPTKDYEGFFVAKIHKRK